MNRMYTIADLPSAVDEMVDLVASHIPLQPESMDYLDVDAYAEIGIGVDSEYCPDEYDL